MGFSKKKFFLVSILPAFFFLLTVKPVKAGAYKIVSPSSNILSITCTNKNNCSYYGVVGFQNITGQNLYDTTLWANSPYNGLEYVGFDGQWTSGQSTTNRTIEPGMTISVEFKVDFPQNYPGNTYFAYLNIDGKTCNFSTTPPDCYFYGGTSLTIKLEVVQPSPTPTPTPTLTPTPTPILTPPNTPTPTPYSTNTSKYTPPTPTPTASMNKKEQTTDTNTTQNLNSQTLSRTENYVSTNYSNQEEKNNSHTTQKSNSETQTINNAKTQSKKSTQYQNTSRLQKLNPLKFIKKKFEKKENTKNLKTKKEQNPEKEKRNKQSKPNIVSKINKVFTTLLEKIKSLLGRFTG